MTPEVALRITLGAIFGFAAIYHALLFGGRPDEREHLFFSVVAVGFGTLSVANAALLSATSVDDAMVATRVSGTGALAVLGALHEYARTAEQPRHRTSRGLLLYLLIGAIAIPTGLFLTADGAHSPWLGGAHIRYRAIEVTLPGRIYFCGLGALMLPALYHLQRGARRRPELRPVVVSWVVTLFMATHDMITRLTDRPSYMLSEIFGLATIVTMTTAVLGRFVHAEKSLQQRTEELGRSHDELQEMQEQLVRRQQLAAVGELSAVIAHEVRNPIAVIKNAVSGLRRSRVRESDRATLLGILDEETDRLTRLMHDLLAYARPVTPDRRLIDLSSMIDECVGKARASVAHLAGEGVGDGTGIEVLIELDPAVESVYGDPKLLHQALLNVIENALQASTKGGQIEISARPTAVHGTAAVEIAVRDRGHGMDGSVHAKAKEPFFTTRPRGTGLGLAIVERTVANHGGDIRIETNTGVGTTVRIVLPSERPSALPSQPDPAGRRAIVPLVETDA